MYCPHCGKERIDNTRYCPHCGNKRQRDTLVVSLIFSVLISTVIISATIFIVQNQSAEPPPDVPSANLQMLRSNDFYKGELSSLPVAVRRELEEDQRRELTEIIADAQQTVFTIYGNYNQGSGFLYNDQGIVITNAHVVEGDYEVTIRTINGVEYMGTIIGYSNETDIAVVNVPELVGTNALTLETSESVMVGEEVIALGSPLGFENTATMGYVTGIDRNFVIDSYIYENLYQISAPISPGSSGGPLLAKNTEKIIAINSAQNIDDTSIGFSIPLYTVVERIEEWIHTPMDEEEILAQYYRMYDEDYFDEESPFGEWFFDGGYYSEEDYYEYWEYDFYDFWNEYGYDYWDDYFEEWDYEDEEWYYDEDFFDEWIEEWYREYGY
ncbi:trypsin-like peptidase domain-containing protein [Evansella sp. AB-P1]|uniref:trypsin-like peptidase domain-containing protein n=1 Tax=Evansella sp. AB-P1 TaxID=3037653 RepID=UPI00241EC077|nr:trypsin-like peptidase domain-containing protein [Evansella sp. AB-P1]MDG5786019.1 trypsin-like peptidase domain-containing protein [Evansella sp. AB-P1]